ncbi:MAG: hypothetical protein LBS56_05675 [Propionibacteriaceae bacterium]|jgi:predicted amidohydrolase|nr:hypothetical protein [Propionibacteriaceae bacterium]
MTTNAIYSDLRRILTSGASQSLADRYLENLRQFRPGDQVSEKIGMLLDSARHKFDAWDRRRELREQYSDATYRLDGNDFHRATMVLESSPPLSPDFFGLSSQQSFCDDKLSLLRGILGMCRAAFSLLQHLDNMNLRDRSSPEQASLFEASSEAEAVSLSWDAVIGDITRHKDVWLLDDTNLSIADTVRQDAGDARLNALPFGPVRVLAETANYFDAKEQQLGICRLVDVLVRVVKILLTGGFKPNVRRGPLPEPFEIDLTDLRPLSYSSERPIEVDVKDAASKLPDTCRIASLRVNIPQSWHRRTAPYPYHDDDFRGQVRRMILSALKECSDARVAFLLLPEYLIPRDSLSEIIGAAKEYGISLIGGIEGGLVRGRSVNEALVCVAHADLEIRQRKMRPSVFEVEEGFAYGDCLTLIRNTELGVVAVVICSDFLEEDVIRSLVHRKDDRLHTLVVVARNDKVDVFGTLARADAVRFFGHVVVVNSLSASADGQEDWRRGGCVVALPQGDGFLEPRERLTIEPKGIDIKATNPQLYVWDLDIASIEGRRNRRSPRGWLPVTYWARQG